MTPTKHFRELGKAVLETEAKAVLLQLPNIDENFHKACELLLACQGRVILMGMGKSGHIARKIAATFASTGSPAFFIHAAEAIHGDLGMITQNDIVIALSFSGETREVVNLLPDLKRIGAPIIAITGHQQSTLAREANILISITIENEACPLGLAPTSSTTAMLAMGDALAIALLDARGFTKKDFARAHPGGQLGYSLRHVADLMHQGDKLPTVSETDSLETTLSVMSEKKLGAAFIVNKQGLLLGIFTDGDLRRFLCAQKKDIHVASLLIKDLAIAQYKTIHAQALVEEALHLMEEKKIMVLPVIDEQKILVGVIHMHDLINAKVA